MLVAIGAAGVLVGAMGCAGDVDPGSSGSGGSGIGGNGGTGAVGVGGTAPTPAVTTLSACTTPGLEPPLMRRLGATEFARTIQDAFSTIPTTDWSSQIRLGVDTLSSLHLGNDASVLLVGKQTAEEILSSAEAIATTVTATANLNTVLPCAAATPNETCAGTFVSTVGKRLFRRALAADERERYLATYRSVAGRSDFKTGIKWALVAMIQSPRTLYRSEVGTKVGTTYSLSQVEIASQLAYDFGGGPPTDALLGRAERNELGDPTVLVTEARALLATPGGRDVLRRFYRQWSKYERVANEVKNNVANFDVLRGAMLDETQRFIDEVVVNRQGKVADLLTASFTMLNGPLAQLYGYGNATAAAMDWTEVNRPATFGLGLLAQGSMLAGNAHGDSSSPTLRGLVVFERLLCNERPPVPANVPRIEEPSPGAKTTRQRYETAHAGSGACNVCHLKFDPIGFAFEHFDEVGRYRAAEGGLPIDATGRALAPDGSVLTSFDGLTDLATKLGALPQVSNCIGGFIETYTFGGGGGQSCLAPDARKGLTEGRYGLLEFTAQLAASPNFVRRTAP